MALVKVRWPGDTHESAGSGSGSLSGTQQRTAAPSCSGHQGSGSIPGCDNTPHSQPHPQPTPLLSLGGAIHSPPFSPS